MNPEGTPIVPKSTHQEYLTEKDWPGPPCSRPSEAGSMEKWKTFSMSSKSCPNYGSVAGMIPPRRDRKENISRKGYFSRQMCEMQQVMLQTRKSIHRWVTPGSTDIQGYFQPDIQSAFDLFVSKVIALAMTDLKINTPWVSSLKQGLAKGTSARHEREAGKELHQGFWMVKPSSLFQLSSSNRKMLDMARRVEIYLNAMKQNLCHQGKFCKWVL